MNKMSMNWQPKLRIRTFLKLSPFLYAPSFPIRLASLSQRQPLSLIVYWYLPNIFSIQLYCIYCLLLLDFELHKNGYILEVICICIFHSIFYFLFIHYPLCNYSLFIWLDTLSRCVMRSQLLWVFGHVYLCSFYSAAMYILWCVPGAHG